jgi:hypothetical protein
MDTAGQKRTFGKPLFTLSLPNPTDPRSSGILGPARSGL